MKKSILLLLLSSVNLFAATSANDALQKLQEGNKRYINDALEHPNRSLERREETESLQKPFATILGCADSRVSPEILFDQGIGDLFIVRVAGNCLGDLEKESLLYSALNLGSSLIVVLGHVNCGAVKAVLQGEANSLPGLLAHIEPAVKNAPSLAAAIKQNVLYVEKQLKALPELADLLASGKLRVTGAVYDLATGTATFLNP